MLRHGLSFQVFDKHFVLRQYNYEKLCIHRSVIFATAALHMALMLHKDSIHDWYSEPQLHNIKLMAFFVTDVTVATFLGYLFYAYYYSIRKHSNVTSETEILTISPPQQCYQLMAASMSHQSGSS